MSSLGEYFLRIRKTSLQVPVSNVYCHTNKLQSIHFCRRQSKLIVLPNGLFVNVT